jgi:hypothetical protein
MQVLSDECLRLRQLIVKATMKRSEMREEIDRKVDKIRENMIDDIKRVEEGNEQWRSVAEELKD